LEPAFHAYPVSAIFPVDGGMTTFSHGSFDPKEAGPPAWLMRGATKRLSSPIMGSLNYTCHYDGEMVVNELKAYPNSRISFLNEGAKPDGYTLSAGKANWSSILPALEGRTRGPDDMEAVCRINSAYTFLLVLTSSPFKTLKELIDYAKANPDKLTFGNSGVWSMVDLEWRWLEMKAGMKTRNVNYSGGGEAILGLLGGHIMASSFSPGAGLPQLRPGRIRALAYTGRKRHPALPDVPTFIEQGYDNGLDGNWQGFLAPKGTPRPIIEKLAAVTAWFLPGIFCRCSSRRRGDQQVSFCLLTSSL
jgi:hypothetical protein